VSNRAVATKKVVDKSSAFDGPDTFEVSRPVFSGPGANVMIFLNAEKRVKNFAIFRQKK
jgi:hypothetical protein